MTNIDWSDTLPSADSVLRWHIAIAQPGLDYMAKQALRVRGYTVYRPIMPSCFTDRRRRQQSGSKSMFPRYLFVLPIRSGWESLRTAPGMVYGEHALMKTNGQLATVSHNDPSHVGVVQIRELEQSLWTVNTNGDHTMPRFKVGDQVRIKKGPWIEFCGQIETLDDESRICVLVKLLGGPRRVFVSSEHLVEAATA
jgi:transcription antitermination factor NusG